MREKMSREIKFRVWGKKEKDFIKCCVLKSDGSIARPVMKNNYDISSLNPNDFDVNFYTGLKDSKGVEIYEGDILKYGSCVEVVFYEPTMGRFMTKLKKCNDESEIGEISSLSPYYTDNYKVIGNIYENQRSGATKSQVSCKGEAVAEQN